MSDFKVKAGLAQMLKGGVIMDVVTAEQAVVAERAGACAVMALEKIPADMRKSGQVCRMSDPRMIRDIMSAVSIPVMAKVRIGHSVEAQVLEALEVDYIDESEVLTPADKVNHIKKSDYKVPFVCGAKDLGEALRRINEGAAMIRTKGEAGTGDVSEAVKHITQIRGEIAWVREYVKSDSDFEKKAKELRVPVSLLKEVVQLGKLPVVNFAAGGVATPADAALLMQLGCDGVFVGSGIFKSSSPEKLAKSIVQATTHYQDPLKLLEFSTDLGDLMAGTSIDSINKANGNRLSEIGW
ncbi:LADA_0G10374g1_1 [Lachancea dasiensis]|uniref:pyridoxal 5'-phosphate synthase (glutamine hydrolyzing) n=1 Tax=Lachancea dasiensis TaxID=1072105 RepID=A0A1G4JUV0_9SACH|nr:LADA_0G10374g1_1 [Lachancea dasiensis]